MSLENGRSSDTTVASLLSDHISVNSPAIDASAVTIESTGVLLIANEVKGNVNSVTTVQTNCTQTIIHQQNVTNVHCGHCNHCLINTIPKHDDNEHATRVEKRIEREIKRSINNTRKFIKKW